MRIPAPFCSFYAFHRNCSYSLGSLLRTSALFSSILLLLFIPQTLLLLFRVIIAHPSSILLFFSIPQTLLLLFTVIITHQSSILLFSCISQTLLLLFRVIVGHPSFILLFFSHSTDLALTLKGHYCASQLHSALFLAFHRPCSYSLWSLLLIPAPFCSFSALQRPCSYSLRSLLRIPAPFCSFSHSTDLALTLKGHHYTSQLHPALFLHSTDLVLTL